MQEALPQPGMNALPVGKNCPENRLMGGVQFKPANSGPDARFRILNDIFGLHFLRIPSGRNSQTLRTQEWPSYPHCRLLCPVDERVPIVFEVVSDSIVRCVPHLLADRGGTSSEWTRRPGQRGHPCDEHRHCAFSYRRKWARDNIARGVGPGHLAFGTVRAIFQTMHEQGEGTLDTDEGTVQPGREASTVLGGTGLW